MFGKLRQLISVDYLRAAARAKLQRAVDEVVRPYHEAQIGQIERLRDEICGLRVELLREADRIVEFSRQVEIRARRDVFAAGERIAVAESARLVAEQMSGAVPLNHPHATLEHALSLAPTGGMALEFGVYTGTTLKIIAAARGGKQVYGFDSFEGLPENWRAGYPAGTFDIDGRPQVSGAELVVGWFDKVLPAFLVEHPDPVDFLHVDADLYSSAKTVLEAVGPRLRPGSVVVFDEYFNYSGWQEHEYRAWQEYVAATGIAFTYACYTLDNEQVAVRITEV